MITTTTLNSSFNPDFSLKNINAAMAEFTFRDFYVHEPYLFVEVDARLFILNSSGFQKLTILGEQQSPDSGREFLFKHNDYLFMIRREHYFGQTPEDIDYLEIIDVSDLTNPFLIGEVMLPSSYGITAHDFHSSGLITIGEQRYIFMHALYHDYFLTINCTTINTPTLVEYNNFPGEAGIYYGHYQRFYVHDNQMFIPTKNSTDSKGFVVYNFTSLQALTKVTEWFGNTNVSSFDSIQVSQDYVYMKSVEAHIEVISIQNLTAPTRKGYINLGFCHKSYFHGDYLIAFLGLFDYPNITIFDYSDIGNLTKTSSYLHPGIDYGKFNFLVFTESMITSSHIYVPIEMTDYGDKTLYIFDWSDPYNLTVKATFGFIPKTNTSGLSIFLYNSFLLFMVAIVYVIEIKYMKRRK